MNTTEEDVVIILLSIINSVVLFYSIYKIKSILDRKH